MIPGLSEAVVRSQTTKQSFARGREYFERGAVLSLTRRGRAIKGEVEGNEYTPYQVRIEFDAGGVTGVTCTCAYAWRGWCKHVVAVALACVYAEPELAATAGPEDLLAELDRRQLQAVLRNMAGRNPRLGRQIQREIERLHWDLHRDEAFDEDAAGAKQYEQRVGAIIHSLDYLPSAEAYWYVGGVVDQLRQVLGEAQQALAQGDSRDALNILAGLIAAMVEEWTVLDDSDGIVSEFWYELDEPLTQALLGAQLSPSERRYWADSLYSWINELGYYGVDDAFDRSLMAAELLDEDGDVLERLAAQDQAPPPPLVEPLLSVLNRRNEHERYLDIAQRAGHRLAYALKLIELERVTEAIEFGHDQAWTADEALTIVQALDAVGRPEAVLAFARQGLYGLGDKAGLALWLQAFAASLDQRELALEAYMEALQAAPSLEAYLRLEELAGPAWPQVRSQTLNALRARSYGWTEPGLVDILLHEDLVEDAIAKIGERPDAETLARVVEKAISVRPGWAIRQSLSQAMRIIEPGQSRSYPQAVEWLRRARDAHRAAGREADWQKFVNELKTSPHGRKHKLMGLLEQIE
jgi:uncharacterized Zn finger protein